MGWGASLWGSDLWGGTGDSRINELLSQDANVERRMFVLIDGIEPIFWQYSPRALPTRGYARSGIEAFVPPETEWSTGLDVKEMMIRPSAMTISLRNIDAPADPTIKYFAQLFAPGRWSQSGANYCMLRVNAGTTKLESSGTEICTDRTLGAWASSGAAYIGAEAFSYTGIDTWADGGRFTGCVRGLYPIAGGLFGQTHYMNDDESKDRAYGQIISDVPLSFYGRRVAVYVTVFDPAAGEYLPRKQALRLWTGRISESIAYNPRGDNWELACTSILSDLQKMVGTSTKTYPLVGLTVGEKGASFHCTEMKYAQFGQLFEYWSPVREATITVSAGVYGNGIDKDFAVPPTAGFENLVDAINAELIDATNWADVSPNTSHPGAPSLFGMYLDQTTDRVKFVFGDWTSNDDNRQMLIQDISGSDNKRHCLAALGFGIDTEIMLSTGTDARDEWPAAHKINQVYYPADRKYNDGVFPIESWDADDEQKGEGGIYVISPQMKDNNFAEEDRRGLFHITSASTNAGLAVLDLDLTSIWTDRHTYSDSAIAVERGAPATEKEVTAIMGQNSTDGTITIAGIGPIPRAFGPFKLLLYSLLSTGTDIANHATYDRWPLKYSVGMQSELVDVESFERADAEVLARHPELALRTYPIDEGIPWIDIAKREGKIFGYFVTMEGGRVTLKSIADHDTGTVAAELDAGTNAELVEFPRVSQSATNTINNFAFTLTDHVTESERKLSISDEVSIKATGRTKTVDIDHPGLFIGADTVPGFIPDLLKPLLLDRQDMFRFPWYSVRVTLKPSKAYKVNIGDIVRYTASNSPDPYGSGAMNIDALGFVIDAALGPRTHTKAVTLLLYSTYVATEKPPWSAAAIIDREYGTGSYAGGVDNSGTDTKLRLLSHHYGNAADPHDGARFLTGDAIVIYARSADTVGASEASTRWHSTVKDEYQADGAQILTLDGLTLSGYDSAGDVEYVVIPDDYGTCNAAQQTVNAFMADDTTMQLNSTDNPQRLS